MSKITFPAGTYRNIPVEQVPRSYLEQVKDCPALPGRVRRRIQTQLDQWNAKRRPRPPVASSRGELWAAEFGR